MATIAAYSTKFDISATVSFFDRKLRTVRRTFYLRNLSGDALDAQVDDARAIMAEVLGELRHVTGVGIDKVTIASQGRQVSQLIVGLQPNEGLNAFRYAVTFRMTTPCTYVWKHETGKTRWRLYEDDITNEWHRTLTCRADKTATFNLPCYPGDHARQAMSADRPFFLFGGWLKRRRSITGWSAHFDREDAVFLKLMARFGEAGNLAVGEKRYFRTETTPMEVSGTFISPAKPSKPEVPRRSYLASQPTDGTDYVYVVRMGRKNVFKIGKTNDPQGRLSSLQTASPFKLSMTNVFRADNASAAEESLHAALARARMAGEWFRLTTEQMEALAAVERFEEGKFIVGARIATAEDLLGG